MKTKHLIFSFLLSILFISCSTIYSNYYQVYKIKPISKIDSKDNYLVYEDKNCKIFYNFWEDGGNAGFLFYNKNDASLYVNMDSSFFILNGKAFNYFKNRTFSSTSAVGSSKNIISSKGVGVSASKSITGINYSDLIQSNRMSLNSNDVLTSDYGSSTYIGNTVSYNEERKICVPPLSYKYFNEYKITDKIIRHCDLFLNPRKENINSVKFSQNESPFIFKNIISYSIENSNQNIKVENEFYISEITNYPENEITDMKYDSSCGKKQIIPTRHFKISSSSMFYLKYIL